MIFGGLQKLTLLDYPDKTAASVFSVGCNFRCPFCHNKALLDIDAFDMEKAQSESDILGFLETRKGLLDGICISGGEPLIHFGRGLEDFIDNVRALGFLVKLDTNGSMPLELGKLLDSKRLDYVALDVKNSPKKYAVTIGNFADTNDSSASKELSPVSQVEESLKILSQSNVEYELRTTVVKELHAPDDIIDIARWICRYDCNATYYLQQFIDSDNVLHRGYTAHSAEELRAILEPLRCVLPSSYIRGVG